MNLQSHIRQELWSAISGAYQAGNFSHAIIDAMHYLTEVLRAKSGVDSDGATLVGQALGGDSPRLRLNKLQTETEKSVQKGMEQTLRGMYALIRNPRSHQSSSKSEDTQESADATIYFINYLLSFIDQAQEAFTIEAFLERVFDPYFVSSSEYVSLLVSEIPLNKRLDTLIELYRERLRGDGHHVSQVVTEIVDILEEDEIADFLKVVSDELRVIQDETSIKSTLQVLPPTLWAKLYKVSKLRIENKIVKSIREGSGTRGSINGWLGTWAAGFLTHFDESMYVGSILASKLNSEKIEEQLYVIEYFFNHLGDVIETEWQVKYCIKGISKAIQRGDEEVVKCLIEKGIFALPKEWRQLLKAELEALNDTDALEVFEKMDQIPF